MENTLNSRRGGLLDRAPNWIPFLGALALIAVLYWNTFSWWWAIGAVFTGSLLGKAFGTFRAQRLLQTAIAEFNQLLATKS